MTPRAARARPARPIQFRTSPAPSRMLLVWVFGSLQILMCAGLIGSVSLVLGMKESITKLDDHYESVDRILTEVKTRLDTLTDQGVKRADFDAYKTAMYERMRAIEEGNKANAQAIADLTRVQTELTRDVAEINSRTRK